MAKIKIIGVAVALALSGMANAHGVVKLDGYTPAPTTDELLSTNKHYHEIAVCHRDEETGVVAYHYHRNFAIQNPTNFLSRTTPPLLAFYVHNSPGDNTHFKVTFFHEVPERCKDEADRDPEKLREQQEEQARKERERQRRYEEALRQYNEMVRREEERRKERERREREKQEQEQQGQQDQQDRQEKQEQQ